MELNRILVIYKQLSPSAERKMGRSAGVHSHLKTLDELYQLLKSLGIPFEARGTQQLGKVGNHDLVITVGGDGTVLTASHYVINQPILGIKSFGEQSIGFFCAATRQTMGLMITGLLNKRYRPVKLSRLKVSINNHPIKEPVLNDLLFSSAFPASMSKYNLTIGKKTEYQTSSGIWVSTAAGSTAAMQAAGGKVLPINAKKMEYLVREPYSPGKSYSLVKGVVAAGSSIKIQSEMRNGTVSIDGHYIQYPAPTGAIVKVELSTNPLMIIWK